MYVYLGLNIIVFAFALVFENTYLKPKNRKRYSDICYILMCTCLAIVSGLRYGIGVDYNEYYRRYITGYVDGNPLTIFPWVFRLLRHIHFPYQGIIFLCGLGFLVPIFVILYRYQNEYKFYGLGILLGFMFYIYSFNTFRQYLSMGLLVWFGHKFSITKQIHWLVGILICVLIHPLTAIVIPVYFLAYFWKPGKKQLLAMQGIAIVAFCVINSARSEWIVRFFARMILLRIPSYSHYVLSPHKEFIEAVYKQSMEFVPKVFFIPCIVVVPIAIYTLSKEMGSNENIRNKRTDVLLWILKVYFVYIFISSFRFGSEMISRFLQFFSFLGIFIIPESFRYFWGRRKIFLPVLKLMIITVSLYMQVRCIGKMATGSYPYRSVIQILFFP